MIYCDTSLLIAALTPEARSPDIQRWLAQQPPGVLAISWWVQTEFASAMAIKGRTGELDDSQRARVMATWQALLASFTLLPVDRGDFETAGMIVLEPGTRLRGGDALHLAIARSRQIGLVTLDRDLADAAQRNGLGVDL